MPLVSQWLAAVSRWLAARPHRVTIVNVAMLSLLLGFVDSVAVFQAVGAGAVALAAVGFLRRAGRRTFDRRRDRSLYALVLTWVPGLLATALALVGVAAAQPSRAAVHVPAVLLFAIELAMLVTASADLGTPDRPAVGAAD